MRPFVELSSSVAIISSPDIEELFRLDDVASHPRATLLRFGSSATKLGSCSSSRFAFTVSHDHIDSVKPWYLSLKETSGPKFCQPNLSHAFSGPKISPLNARSYSFASPLARSSRGNIGVVKKGFFPSTPMSMPEKTQKFDLMGVRNSTRTPKPSFLQSPALFFQRDRPSSRVERTSESFVPFFKFYQVPYDEMIYRSKMRPPLGGLISIVSPQPRRRHMSISQRF